MAHFQPFASLPINAAVIDVGSNSIRLVVYRVTGRIFHVLHNEKRMCGLAYGMEESGGRISDEALADAKIAIARYVALSRARGVNHIVAFATSAMRDAVNADDILQWVKEKFDIDVAVLSEEEEALYAARGVAQAFDGAQGMAADLGGGSLELIDLPDLNAPMSLPIGPLRFVSDGNFTAKKRNLLRGVIKSQMKRGGAKGKTLYLVGGAFRNIAKFHMLRRKYPLHIIHRYAVLPDRLERTLENLQHTPEEILQKQPALSKKRAQYLPYVAALLQLVIDRAKPDRVAFSSAGVREGVLYSMLPEVARNMPLFDACLQEMRESFYPDGGGDALYSWLRPVIERARAPHGLAIAACMLSGAGENRDGEFRAEFAYHHTMYSPLPALNHKERVWLTLAVVSGYAGTLKESADLLQQAMEILTPEEQQSASAVGKALRFARALSGNYPHLLFDYELTYDAARDCLALTPPADDMLVTKTIEKRLNQLATALSCNYSLSPR